MSKEWLDILSIEDSEADYLLIHRELELSGLSFRCHRVDGKAGLLSALQSEAWDVVLADYAVPGLYFPEVLSQFRSRWPQMPVILVSGSLGDVKASVMIRLGASDFVSKDKLGELAPAIRRQLDLSGA